MAPRLGEVLNDAVDAVNSPERGGWIDELPDGLLVCTLEGVIAVANERLAEMSGYTSAELVGMTVEDLVPRASRDHHPDLRRAFVAAGATRPMGPGVQLTLLRHDLSELPVEISLAPLEGQRGVVAIIRDVTARLRAEALVRNASDLLTVADERERIARDLHDTVLQRLFGLGLELQAAAIRAPADLAERIETGVDEIDRIIREIRTAVFTLGSAGRTGSLGQELSAVTVQAKRVLGFAPRLRMDGPVETATTPEIRVELLASMREALTNIARHANATEAEVELCATDVLSMRVLDNGRGVSTTVGVSEGNGLRNMAERARLLGGGCTIARRADRGSELHWWVPLPDEGQPASPAAHS